MLKKKSISLLLATTMMFGVVATPLASESPSAIDSDAFMTTDMLIAEGDVNWDHETWDELHQELVWAVLATTTWYSTVPPLKFSNKGTATNGSNVSSWLGSGNMKFSDAANFVIQSSNCPEDERDAYLALILALAYEMDEHDNVDVWFTSGWGHKFAVAEFLIGGKNNDVSDPESDSVQQIAKRVMDNRTDASDIYTRDGLQKFLSNIVKTKWVNKILKWIWESGDYIAAVSTNVAGMEYEMSGWGGRVDELGESSNPYAPPTTSPSSTTPSTTP